MSSASLFQHFSTLYDSGPGADTAQSSLDKKDLLRNCQFQASRHYLQEQAGLIESDSRPDVSWKGPLEAIWSDPPV